MYGINAVIIVGILATFVAINQYTIKRLIIDIICMLAMFMVSSSVYFNAEGFKGWPTLAPLQQGYLVSSLVIEPDQKQSGAIYLWVSVHKHSQTTWEKIWAYMPVDKSPRAYQFPFSKELAKEVHESQREIGDGMIVEVGGKIQHGELNPSETSIHPIIISPEQLLPK